MKIAIVGVGEVGAYYARQWSQSGHELILTYFRNQAKVESLVAQLGNHVTFASPREAAAQADVILFCPRFEHMENAAGQMGAVGDAILIDANNPFNPERTGRADIGLNQTAFNMVVNLFPQARHVKAFHNLGIQTILAHTSPELVAFVASDDTDAANKVMALAREAHLTPLLTGDLATAVRSEFPGPLFGIPFSLQEAHEVLATAVRG